MIHLTGELVWALACKDGLWYKGKIVGRNDEDYAFPEDDTTPVAAYLVHYHGWNKS